MTRSYDFRRGVWVLSIGLAFMTGCQSGGSHSSQTPTLLSDGRGVPHLNAEQVADVQHALGRSVEQAGEVKEAEAYYQEAVKRDPKRADAWLRLAVLHDRQGKFTESAEMYRRALAARPGDPAAYCNLGYSYYLQGRTAEAEMNLRQAIALRPDHRHAHNNLGLVLARSGRPEEALEEFRRAGCTEADAHNNLAFALTLEG